MTSGKSVSKSKILNDFTNDAVGELMYSIHALYIGIQKHLEQVLLAKKGVSFSQFLILINITCIPKSGITAARLSDALMIKESTVSRHISTLTSMGLLTREKDQTTRRDIILHLPPLGKKQ